MENQEKLERAGVLNPQGELTPELSDAVESLTPDEVDDLISGRNRLAAAEDERGGGEGPPDDLTEGLYAAIRAHYRVIERNVMILYAPR